MNKPHPKVSPELRAAVDAITKTWVDRGKLIEAGWQTYLLAGIRPGGVSPIELAEMRTIFFAGAQHLWGSIFSFLEPGKEETASDLARMDLIQKELNAFYEEMKTRPNN